MPDSAVDRHWLEATRARRVVLFVDVVESVRLMATHEDDVLSRWLRFVDVLRTQVLPEHGGRLVRTTGDGLLIELTTVPQAIACALAIQRHIGPFNAGSPTDAAIWLRVGAHVADVVVEERELWGSGVNLAARLCTLARPGGIVVSAEVRDGLIDGFDAEVEDFGDCHLKHLDAPVRIYAIGSRPHDLAPKAPPRGPVLAVVLLHTAAGRPGARAGRTDLRTHGPGSAGRGGDRGDRAPGALRIPRVQRDHRPRILAADADEPGAGRDDRARRTGAARDIDPQRAGGRRGHADTARAVRAAGRAHGARRHR
jgi:class 3 adenylate cyclase